VNAFYIPDRVVDRGGDSTIESFVVHLPSIETVGLPLDSREVPFPKSAFRILRPCGKDRLLNQVSTIVFIVLTVHNSLSTLILVALE
jgi:hypothetical protein